MKKQTDQELMDELFETTTYVAGSGGEIQDWRTMPELGTSPDEPDYEEVMRAVATRKAKERRAAKKAAR